MSKSLGNGVDPADVRSRCNPCSDAGLKIYLVEQETDFYSIAVVCMVHRWRGCAFYSQLRRRGVCGNGSAELGIVLRTISYSGSHKVTFFLKTW